ncbi:Hypothetical protein CINCED_3A022406 [Cinara cedri]|uniref:Uncharacterized protein n=1 Tax=Cinara cedri TaxID=506608 RepID=A0A5E4M2I8_9HEMI|nr:Hypothetical protein CINCED_3A022406 [Cinara cedri]
MRLFLYTLLVSTLAISKTVRTDNPQPSDQTNLELSVSNDQSNSYQNQNSLKADVTNDGKHASLDASSQTVQNSQSKNELHLNIEQSDTDSDPNDSTISNSAMTNENINTLQQQSYNFKESNSLLLNMQNNNIDNDNNNSPDSGTDDLESNNPTGQNFGLISPQPDGASPQILGSGIQTNSPTQGQNIMSLSGTDPNSINNADAYGPTQPRDSSSPQGSPINYNDDNIPTAGGSSNGNTPPSSGGTTSPDSSQIGSGSLPISTSPGGQNGLNPSLFDPNSPNDAGTFGPSQFPDSSSLQGSPNNNNNDNIPPAGGISNGNTPPSSGGPASPDSPQIGSGSLPISTSPGGQNGLNPSLFDPNSPNDAGTFGPSQFPDSSSLQGSPNNNNNDNIPPAGGLSNGNSPPSSEGSSTVTNLYTKSSELSNSEYFNGGVSHSESSQFEESISITSDSTEMETQQYVLNSYSSGKFICDGYGKIIGVVFNHSADSGQGLDTIDLDTNSVIWEDINMLGLDIYQFSGNAGNYVGDKADNAYTSSKNSLGDAANYVGDKADNAYTSSKNSLGDAAAGGSSNGNTPPSSGGPSSLDSPQIGSGSLPISTSPGGQNGLNPSLFDPNSPNDAGTFGPSQFPDSSSLQGSPNNNNNDNIPPAGGSSNGNTPPSSGGPASPSYPQFGIGLVPLSYLPSGQNGVNPSLFDPNSINNAGGSSNGNTPPSSGGPASPDSPQIGSGSIPISTSPGGQNGLNPSLFDPNSPNDAGSNDAGSFGPSQFPDSSSLQGSPNNNNNDNIPPAGGLSNGNSPPSSEGSSTVTNLYTKSSELSNSEYFNGGVSHSESSQFEESISITSDSTEMETQQYVLNSYSSGKFICDGYGKIIGVVFNHSADSGQGLDTIDLDTNSVIWEDINMLGLDIYQFSGNAGNYVGDKADNAYTSSKNSLGDAANYVGDKADNAYTASKNSLGDAANYVGDKADNAYTSSKNSLGDAANHVGDIADNAYTSSKNSLGDAANYVGDKADNAYTASKNSLGDAANYVGDKAGAVNDASKEAGNSIHSATNDYGHDLYDAGHNFKENAFGSSDGDVTNNV